MKYFNYLVLFLSVLVSTSQAQKWERVGPNYKPTKGLTYQVIQHPNKPNSFIVGTRPQGLFLTEDSGKTWKRTSKKFPQNGNVGSNPESIFRAPSNPEIVYAGIETKGIWKSNDGGKTWKVMSKTLPKGRARNGVSVAIHPTNPDICWYGSDGGLFKTVDGGKNWQRITQGLPSGTQLNSKDIHQTITKIFIDQNDPKNLWIGMYASGHKESAGVWKSTDGGNTWSHSSTGIESGPQKLSPVNFQKDWIMAFSQSKLNPNTFLASTPFAVYISEDGCATWKKLSLKHGSTANAIHPSMKNTLLLGKEDGGVKISRDMGKTWEDLNEGLPIGKVPNAPVYKVNFPGPDGKIQQLEGVDKRYLNKVHSFSFDLQNPNVIYISTHAGWYKTVIKP